MKKRPSFDLVGPSGESPVGPSTRQLRVAEEIRHVLADVFTRTEFRDPELYGVTVTVTEVRVSPDLRHATVFVIRLGRDDIEAVLPALKRVAPFLRKRLSGTLRLRTVPELHFQPDISLEHAMEVESILRLPEVQRDLHKDYDDTDEG